MTTTSGTVLVGFGANYNLNMGQAVQSTLPHTDGEYLYDNDDSGECEAKDMDVPCYQLPAEDYPWNDGKDELIQMATSSASSFFLTKGGSIYTCGTLHGKVSPSLTKTVIQLPLKCVEIAAGRHFALARMEGGLAVCSWGAGHFGQLALGGDSAPFMEHPTVVEALLPHVVGAPIVAIAAGYWHAMAVTQAGALYSWGCNRNSQCGFKPSKEPPTLCAPQPVQFETAQTPRVVKIAAGRSHSVCLDDEGKIYCWGACQYGQCGLFTRRRGGVAPPKQVESLSQVQIVDIAAGDTHTLALTGGGRVFAFGGGFEGQLGTSSIVQLNPKPKLVGDLDFVAIEAGREWKSQQKQKQDDNDDAEGSSTFDASFNSSPHTSLSQIPKIVSVHATGNCSMALSSNGHLYVWGCNDVGNLGVPKLDTARLPFAEPGVPPSKTSTLRQFHSQSFDSSHNIGLPQRVDCLAHVNITHIAASPTFLWCYGSTRQGGDLEANAVGRTLYELQEEKRQKSLRLHRQVTKKDENAPSSTTSLTADAKQDQGNSPIDPPEMKDGSQVGELSVDVGNADHLLHTSSLDSTEANDVSTSSPLKSPRTPTKNKKRFSLPKVLGKIVRRASSNSHRGDSGGEENDKKGRKA